MRGVVVIKRCSLLNQSSISDRYGVGNNEAEDDAIWMETPSPKGDLTPQRPNRRKSKAKVHRATDRLVGQVYAAQVQRNVVFFNFKDVFFSNCSFHFLRA